MFFINLKGLHKIIYTLEIELISPNYLLRQVMFQMKNRLNRLGEKIYIKDLNHPSKSPTSPSKK